MSERDVFLTALDQPDAAARAAYLDRACAGNPALREKVDALLRSRTEAGSFLGVPLVAPSDADPEYAATRDFSADASDDTDGDPKLDEALALLAPSSLPDSLGRIGHYEVLQVLGQGAFGIVFRAFDEALKRVVAVKVLAPQLAATSPARKRFIREAHTSAQVRHENVVAVHDVGESPLPYLVMEFIPGETLQQRLDRIGPIEPAEVVRIGRQIAEGLAAAHATDLVHRDIKPGNILLDGAQQRVKITDFGLARAADDASISQSGLVAGTPMYMSPEQAKGHHIDHRSDLFSLGSVLYQMVSGRPPFRANGALAVLKRVADDTPRPIRESIPEVPQWLCDIIAHLHEKKPDDRFQSAREVADVLADCEAQLKGGAKLHDFSRIPRSAAKPRGRRSGRRKWVAAAVLVLLPLIVLAGLEVAGVTHFLQSDRPVPGPSAVVIPPPTPAAANNPVQTPPVVEPRVDAEIRRIAALPPEQQVEEVRKELMRRNPDFDGQMEHPINGTVVTKLKFTTEKITDLSPLLALPGLEVLMCTSGEFGDLGQLRGLKLKEFHAHSNPKITDLRPLVGMPLEVLHVWQWEGTDLTPLKGMRLRWLNCGGSFKKFDLAPISELPLEYLCINYTEVPDLTPLRNLPLQDLECAYTPITDLSPLRGKRLQLLALTGTKVSDLTILRDMPLTTLFINETPVSDLSPLKDLPLRRLRLPPRTRHRAAPRHQDAGRSQRQTGCRVLEGRGSREVRRAVPRRQSHADRGADGR